MQNLQILLQKILDTYPGQVFRDQTHLDDPIIEVHPHGSPFASNNPIVGPQFIEHYLQRHCPQPDSEGKIYFYLGMGHLCFEETPDFVHAPYLRSVCTPLQYTNIVLIIDL